eukprot:PhF_6_TR18605/c0_g1_i1/m.27184
MFVVFSTTAKVYNVTRGEGGHPKLSRVGDCACEIQVFENTHRHRIVVASPSSGGGTHCTADIDATNEQLQYHAISQHDPKSATFTDTSGQEHMLSFDTKEVLGTFSMVVTMAMYCSG